MPGPPKLKQNDDQVDRTWIIAHVLKQLFTVDCGAVEERNQKHSGSWRAPQA